MLRLPLRLSLILKRQIRKEPLVQLCGVHAAPLPVFFPVRQHPLPEYDLLPFRFVVAVERFKRFGCGGGRSIRRGRQLRSLAGVMFFLRRTGQAFKKEKIFFPVAVVYHAFCRECSGLCLMLYRANRPAC